MQQRRFFVLAETIAHIGKIELRLFADAVDGQPQASVFALTQSDACFGIDGGFSERNGDSDQTRFLPVEQFVQVAGLFEPVTTQSETFQLFPVDFGLVDGGYFLCRSKVVEIHPDTFQHSLVLRFLTSGKHVSQFGYRLDGTVGNQAVYSEMGRVFELLD